MEQTKLDTIKKITNREQTIYKRKGKAFHEQKKQVKKNFSDVFGNPLKGYPQNEEIILREL